MMKLILLTFLIFSKSPFAAEVDTFTRRYQDIPNNAIYALNAKTKDLINEVLEKENKKNRGCKKSKLYKKLRKKFRFYYLSSEFIPFIHQSSEIERIEVKTKDSIYKEFNAFVPGVVSKLSDKMADYLIIDNVFLGTDKFEHFLGTGYVYFRTAFLKEKGIEKAMKIGKKMENGPMGSLMTGVKSYGDLVANFNGMRFWNHVLQDHEDPLNINLGPYVACENSKWVTKKRVDWSQYIDHGFDEAVNCSKFQTKHQASSVKTHIKEIEGRTTDVLNCPVLPKSYQDELIVKYGKYADKLLNFEGHSVR